MVKIRISARTSKRRVADKAVMDHMKMLLDKVHEVNVRVKKSEFELTEFLLDTPYFKARR